MAELVSVEAHFIYGRNDPELTWPVSVGEGQTVMVVIATTYHPSVHLQGDWENMLDPEWPNEAIGGEGTSGESFAPFRWVGEGQPTEVHVMVDGYASANVYVWVLQLEEGEEIGGWRYGTSGLLGPGDRVSLQGEPEAEGETFVLGQIWWTLPT